MENLLSRHHLAKRAFALSGYAMRYSQYEREIEQSGADVVFVCLGSPKQELFIAEVREKFPSVLFVGLGGSADIYSGRKKRAPALLRHSGAEWLWRMAREPKRILRLPKIMRFFSEVNARKRKTRFFSKKQATNAHFNENL